MVAHRSQICIPAFTILGVHPPTNPPARLHQAHLVRSQSRAAEIIEEGRGTERGRGEEGES